MKTALTNNSPNAVPATPAQQKQFDLLLGRCRQVMGEAGKEWLDTLKHDPVEGAVMLGTGTLRGLVEQSEKAGQPVDPGVLLQTGIQLCKDVAAVANAAGIVPDDQLKQYLKETLTRSMMQYLKDDAAEGKLSPQDQQQAQGFLAKMEGGGAAALIDPGAAATADPAAPGPVPPEAAPEQPPVQGASPPMTEEDQMAAELEQIRASKAGGVQ